MRVKIVKSAGEYCWYRNRIGEVFEVKESADYSLYSLFDNRWMYIRKEDCIIVTKEEKEMNNVELAREILGELY